MMPVTFSSDCRDRLFGLLLISLITTPGLIGAAPAHCATEVTAYNTYLGPPFIEGKEGLMRDLIELLNLRLAGEYTLLLENIPRRRLVEDIISNNLFGGVVLLLNPKFLDDEDRTKYLWSDALYTDHNVMIFKSGPPTLDAQGLKGLKFGAVMNNRYLGLDDFVDKGILTRISSPNELSSLRNFADGKTDFLQMNRSMFFSLARYMAGIDPDGLQVIPDPWFPEFTRHIMVGRGNPRLAKLIFSKINDLNDDPAWTAILRRYHIRD